MKQLNQFIQEKLKLDKNIEIDLEESDEYNGVHLITQNNMSKSEFERYGAIPLKLAYKIIKKIIDHFSNELKGFYFSLFYSGYSGFVIYNPEYNENNKYDKNIKIGIIGFSNGAKLDGTNVSYITSSKLKKYEDINNKLRDFIRNAKLTFNDRL